MALRWEVDISAQYVQNKKSRRESELKKMEKVVISV
jgi:hypothetical protein